MWCISIWHATSFSCIVKDEFSEISIGMFYLFKRLNGPQFFFFNLDERKVSLFTNKQELLTLLHLRSFRQSQNLTEGPWSRAAENFIALCFLAFLSNKSKKCFILVSSSEIIAISILHYVQISRVKFCGIKAENFQAIFLILLASHWNRG